MKRASWWLVVGVFGVMSGCTCAQLPDATFQCEPDGSCQAGFTCGADQLCHPTADQDGGHDAGFPDAGEPDAGPEDAGTPDASVMDAGPDDAGFDAGLPDAGLDDAGLPDAGPDDAGLPDAGTDAGTCVPTGAIDEPDALGLDVDCDGFDGDLSRAVFVDGLNGDDTNAGTRLAPLKTLGAALTTGKPQLYLSTGTFAGDLTLSTAVALFGGYDATTWSRTSTRTTLAGAVVAQPADGGRMTFDHLTITASQPATAGEASIALTLHGAGAGSRITDCRLVGGQGADGAQGTPGAPAASGHPGHAGLTTDGGAGGSGADCGDAGFSPDGFSGGTGGEDVPGDGLAGDGPAGGLGGLVTVCTTPPCEGLDGGDGTAGSDGLMSSSRPADPPTSSGFGAIVGGQWQGVSLGTWTPAQHGRGGSGAGGGGALLDGGLVLLARAGGGGGGGSGGCGARSGTAGHAGGASIALLLIDSSPTLANVQLVTTQGGNGGRGGNAGARGAGGAGAVGGAGEAVVEGTAGSGGRGGAGGLGGPGRQGPGGWGGPVIGVFCSGSANPVRDNTTTWTAGTPGAGGNGDPVGQAGGQPPSGYSVGCP